MSWVDDSAVFQKQVVHQPTADNLRVPIQCKHVEEHQNICVHHMALCWGLPITGVLKP